jgi:hypothetical protein
MNDASHYLAGNLDAVWPRPWPWPQQAAGKEPPESAVATATATPAVADYRDRVANQFT